MGSVYQPGNDQSARAEENFQAVILCSRTGFGTSSRGSQYGFGTGNC